MNSVNYDSLNDIEKGTGLLMGGLSTKIAHSFFGAISILNINMDSEFMEVDKKKYFNLIIKGYIGNIEFSYNEKVIKSSIIMASTDNYKVFNDLIVAIFNKFSSYIEKLLLSENINANDIVAMDLFNGKKIYDIDNSFKAVLKGALQERLYNVFSEYKDLRIDFEEDGAVAFNNQDSYIRFNLIYNVSMIINDTNENFKFEISNEEAMLIIDDFEKGSCLALLNYALTLNSIISNKIIELTTYKGLKPSIEKATIKDKRLLDIDLSQYSKSEKFYFVGIPVLAVIAAIIAVIVLIILFI